MTVDPWARCLTNEPVDNERGSAEITMTTLDLQKLQIPFGWAVLQELHSVSGEALAHLAKEKGETL